jgi:hypothetical protein
MAEVKIAIELSLYFSKVWGLTNSGTAFQREMT